MRLGQHENVEARCGSERSPANSGELKGPQVLSVGATRMWPKSGLVGDNVVMGRNGYRDIGSFGGHCGSMGARRPFVVCNDQLLHFWIVQSSDALSGSHGHTVQTAGAYVCVKYNICFQILGNPVGGGHSSATK